MELFNCGNKHFKEGMVRNQKSFKNVKHYIILYKDINYWNDYLS